MRPCFVRKMMLNVTLPAVECLMQHSRNLNCASVSRAGIFGNVNDIWLRLIVCLELARPWAFTRGRNEKDSRAATGKPVVERSMFRQLKRPAEENQCLLDLTRPTERKEN